MEPITYEQPKKTRKTTLFVVVIVVLSLFAGTAFGYFAGYSSLSDQVASLENEVSSLQQQLANLETSQSTTTTVNLGNVSLSDLYAQVEDSVVVIHGLVPQYDMFGRAYYSEIQGSGFVYEFVSQMVIITNSHVVDDAVNITVTFNNGNSYPAEVLGSDPYAELAVISAEAPETEFKPLQIASSSNLQVGDPVLVVGTPYGLAGSMSTGVISALGRTLSADTTGGYVIANVIQTTAALNPGNSGGPVLNYQGQVIGIATAIVEDSEGLGFAIPSNTILREINDLVNNGSYNDHPWLGAAGTDMTYEIAQELDTDITYGWLISYITIGGPADHAGLQGGTDEVVVVSSLVTIGGDIIIAVNGTRITSIDDLSSYLEEYTTPGETVELTIIRDNQTQTVLLELAKRPTSAVQTT